MAALRRRSYDRPTRMMRSAPSWRNRFAIANPMPDVPPVIMQVRPVRRANVLGTSVERGRLCDVGGVLTAVERAVFNMRLVYLGRREGR